jgi:hypothetical protein
LILTLGEPKKPISRATSQSQTWIWENFSAHALYFYKFLHTLKGWSMIRAAFEV